MELKEFVVACIERAESAADKKDPEEAQRLLLLAADVIKKEAYKIQEQ